MHEQLVSLIRKIQTFYFLGSALGAPRDLTAISTAPKAIQLAWLPPQPEGPTITAYKIQYSPRDGPGKPIETEVSGNELSCSGFASPVLTGESLCNEITGLKPATAYKFKVQGQAGNEWGPWSSEIYANTKVERMFVI